MKPIKLLLSFSSIPTEALVSKPLSKALKKATALHQHLMKTLASTGLELKNFVMNSNSQLGRNSHRVNLGLCPNCHKKTVHTACFFFPEPTSEASLSFSSQVRYFITVLLGYPLGFFFYHVLSPKYVSLSTRHAFSAITGLFLGYVCLGGW